MIEPIEPGPGNWVDKYVEQCKLQDIEEDVFGDPELTPYNSKQYFNCSVKEIADCLGMTPDGVHTLLKRANAKLARRLLVLAYDGIKTDDEICEILNSGTENIKKSIAWMYI